MTAIRATIKISVHADIIEGEPLPTWNGFDNALKDSNLVELLAEHGIEVSEMDSSMTHHATVHNQKATAHELHHE